MSYGNKEVLKVILLGNGGVGKSSLMRRYVNNVFEEKTLHTIGVEFLNKDVDFNSKTFTLQIWDTGGQERFKSLRTPFYRGSDICILVFDLSDSDSFIEIESWLEEFRKYAEVESKDTTFPFLLLGNKADLPARGTVSSEVYQWCKEHGDIPFIEASAKLDLNVERGFMLMVEKAVEHEQQQRRHNTGQFKDTIKLERNSGENKKKCCAKQT